MMVYQWYCTLQYGTCNQDTSVQKLCKSCEKHYPPNMLVCDDNNVVYYR